MKPFLTDKIHPERIRHPAPPAIFGLPVRTLSIASRWCSPATGALLAGEISRKPTNLHLHLQRIALWHGLSDAAATAAAVIDLWIILGTMGLALRTRMLRKHYAALDTFDLGLYLSEHLQQGLGCHDPHIALPGTLLTRPVAGIQTFLLSADMPPAAPGRT